jgi:hypothetical protein
MKKRFRILRDALPFQYAVEIHNVMWTCCVLHNWLLRWDGKDAFAKVPREPTFNDKTQSDVLSGLDSDEAEGASDSGEDEGFRLPPNERDNPDTFQENETQVEMEAGWSDLRGQLIEHFTYMKRTKKLKWQF